MPYQKTKVDGYQVKNKQTGEIHARGTTSTKAEAQMRLLHGVEHGMTPRNRPMTTREAMGEGKARGKGRKGGRSKAKSKSAASRGSRSSHSSRR